VKVCCIKLAVLDGFVNQVTNLAIQYLILRSIISEDAAKCLCIEASSGSETLHILARRSYTKLL